MFTPEGLPLRASLSATFRSHTPDNLSALLRNLASPDIDHVHQVREGEHLSAIVNGVYNNPAYYLAVAEANALDTVRTVAPGSVLHLPPVR
jgi:nucleoid-associated protein YgaU